MLSRKDGAILLRKRPAKGLLGGMDEVPSSAVARGQARRPTKAMGDAPVPARWQMLDGLVRHTFTHFHLELTVARAIATTGGLAKLAPGTSWCTIDRMTERALPTVMRKVIAHAVKDYLGGGTNRQEERRRLDRSRATRRKWKAFSPLKAARAEALIRFAPSAKF